MNEHTELLKEFTEELASLILAAKEIALCALVESHAAELRACDSAAAMIFQMEQLDTDALFSLRGHVPTVEWLAAEFAVEYPVAATIVGRVRQFSINLLKHYKDYLMAIVDEQLRLELRQECGRAT